MKNMTGRKVKLMRMSLATILPQFQMGKHTAYPYEVIKDGLPRDTEVVSLRYDRRTDQMEFLLESDDWEALAEGAEVPSINPTLRTEFPKPYTPSPVQLEALKKQMLEEAKRELSKEQPKPDAEPKVGWRFRFGATPVPSPAPSPAADPESDAGLFDAASAINELWAKRVKDKGYAPTDEEVATILKRHIDASALPVRDVAVVKRIEAYPAEGTTGYTTPYSYTVEFK